MLADATGFVCAMAAAAGILLVLVTIGVAYARMGRGD